MKNILQIIQEAKNNAPTEIEKLKLSKSLIGATLLSIEEYNEYKDSIPLLNMCWWLRSPGYAGKYAAVVYDDGDVITNGYYVDRSDVAVRPALKITNLESLNLQIKDQFELVTHGFTIISDNLAICNDTFTSIAFRRDGSSNDYEISDVKKYIEDWFYSVYLILNDITNLRTLSLTNSKT